MGTLGKLRAALPAGLRAVRPPERLFGGASAAQLRPRPPAPEAAATAALYVHWPYCEKRCSYCNFNKYIPRNLDEQKMRNCLVREAQTLIQLSQVKRITSVFFGGGTPSLANPLTIASVLDTVSQCAHLAEGTEVTLEANPTSADASCLAEFQKAGVNRLSIGVQGALSTHNLSYWQGSQYIGIGPGAHGRFVPWGDGKVHREARIQTLEPDVWMKEVLAVGHGTRKRTELSKLDILEEVLMLGLRMDIGITHKHWLQFAPDFSLWDAFGESEEVKELEECGLLLLDDKGLRCSWRGLAVLDSLLLTLLNQFQKVWVEREKTFKPEVPT
ncbi:S-adenosyl methionine domain-containing 1, mitochondrial [Podarcis lilfordi]|uniref:S-adenosyl methionine domain-containing 1, mitochondrial n=1 Tax=Podarcis lilfordi TaxID=74358 RepID=A0AA35JTN2_9SAUR|nr:S-adenosyl methionine domain-containing 1, mitochondrial [Podarcis lilfordi]